MRCRKCGAAIAVAVRTTGQPIRCPSCKKNDLAELELELTAKVEALKQRFNRRRL